MSRVKEFYADMEDKLWDICDHVTADPANVGSCIIFKNAAEVLAKVFGNDYWLKSSDYKIAASAVASA